MRNLIPRIKDNFNQIFAIAEKNLKLRLRVKTAFIFSFIQPIIGIILPLIVLGQLITFNVETGPWNQTNFAIFQITAYQLSIIFGVMNSFGGQLRQEKFWQTLSALLIAPFKRINLLLGIFVTHLISITGPFLVFLTIGLIFYPVSIFTILALFFIYFLIAFIFAGIGLILGIGAISKENILTPINFAISIFFMFACISLPFQFFPGYYRNIVVFNPLYYIVDTPRLIWIENNIILSLVSHPFHFGLILILAILSPMIGLIIFNKIFDKYGIQGY